MKIVILGLSKSGTTALFFRLKQALPSKTITLFEPQKFDPSIVGANGSRGLLNLGRNQDVLAKVLPFKRHDPPDIESFAEFDKQILIVRDPRDRLISKLLYAIYDSTFFLDERKVRSLLEVLNQKEVDPAAVPVRQIVEIFERLNGESFVFDQWIVSYQRDSIQRPLDFHNSHPDVFLFRYEQLIDDELDSLENHLALPLGRGDTPLDSEFERVARTKSYGNWRDWLTNEDVEQFKPGLQPFLDRYYPDANWDLNAAPAIKPAHSSEYVLRLVNQRRALMKLGPLVIER